jgi:hypothetical protein
LVSPAASPVTRAGLVVLSLALIGAGGGLGYLAVVALRRSEGVFMPTGYVALACVGAGTYLLRLGLRG